MSIANRKRELHRITTNKKFPDTSNTRYQSHSYAAAELIAYLDLYVELVEETCDSKKQAGYNHLEQNVAKGLEDPSTLAEMAAMALYGLVVSWPYLGIVRGNGRGNVVNLLDPAIISLHRKLPDFCDRIAENPRLLLDENISASEITLDGKPWMDKMLLISICILASEIPDLELMISAMFSGCADGWRQFTQEFVPGGPFDRLTAEQRSRIFIPATNNPNEGALGSWRVNTRFHPNGTASGFSNKARMERNNTEMFIEKVCIDGASGNSAKFRQRLLETQQERALAMQKKLADAEKKKQEEIARLTAVGLIVNRAKISGMTVAQLNDQLSIHRKFLNDEVLLNVLQKDIKLKPLKLSAVLAAVTRNEERINALRVLIENMQGINTNLEDPDNSANNSPPDDEESEENDEESADYDDGETY
ncbi:hypothetical protein B0H34DRAFT_677180 [Crassisporium funariophilum]|nr:hypothetical protein B0H34DRAFT_677180 [Crassisporium funariophilum]